MDKPRFIRGLLEEVGTAINPIDLVRRIPEGLEIEGLREGIGRMVREYEIQVSISEGVARVLRGEVAVRMELLRKGRVRGVKFDIVRQEPEHVDVGVENVKVPVPPPLKGTEMDEKPRKKRAEPGHCVQCDLAFAEDGEFYIHTLTPLNPLSPCPHDLRHSSAMFPGVPSNPAFRKGHAHRLRLRVRLPPRLHPARLLSHQRLSRR